MPNHAGPEVCKPACVLGVCVVIAMERTSSRFPWLVGDTLFLPGLVEGPELSSAWRLVQVRPTRPASAARSSRCRSAPPSRLWLAALMLHQPPRIADRMWLEWFLLHRARHHSRVAVFCGWRGPRCPTRGAHRHSLRRRSGAIVAGFAVLAGRSRAPVLPLRRDVPLAVPGPSRPRRDVACVCVCLSILCRKEGMRTCATARLLLSIYICVIVPAPLANAARVTLMCRFGAAEGSNAAHAPLMRRCAHLGSACSLYQLCDRLRPDLASLWPSLAISWSFPLISGRISPFLAMPWGENFGEVWTSFDRIWPQLASFLRFGRTPGKTWPASCEFGSTLAAGPTCSSAIDRLLLNLDSRCVDIGGSRRHVSGTWAREQHVSGTWAAPDLGIAKAERCTDTGAEALGPLLGPCGWDLWKVGARRRDGGGGQQGELSEVAGLRLLTPAS